MKQRIAFLHTGIFLSALIGIFHVQKAWTHQGVRHHDAQKSSPIPSENRVLKQINADYIARVKPVFQRSCFDCHGSTTNYPWYYKLPGVKQLIDHDVQESKEHLDMTQDFPFRGHASPQEDLKAIQETIEKGEMPLFRYLILHPEAKLKDAEKDAVISWVRRSNDLLENLKKNAEKSVRHPEPMD